MRTPFLSATAALLALAGCSPSATTNTTAANASETNASEPDIIEVPDESADANGAAADIDDGNEADESDNGSGMGNAGASNATR